MSNRGLRLDVALRNQRHERYGDWYQDPWAWPEMDHLASQAGGTLLLERLNASNIWPTTQLRIPKENLGIRPAVVLDPSDRLLYQALVDQRSARLIGEQPRSVYGWRLTRTDPMNGEYLSNSSEYRNYLQFLVTAANQSPGALVTDIVSFFASIPLEALVSHLEDHAPGGKNTDRLVNLLTEWNRTQHVSGIPQRSAASAVLANMYLADLDSLLQTLSKDMGGSWSRWMDDIYVFGPDEGSLRSTQISVDQALRGMGLALNHAKTEVLLDEALKEHLANRDHSAVDSALAMTIVVSHQRGEIEARPNFTALSELVEKVLEEGATSSRTSLRFISSRMRANNFGFSVEEFVRRMDEFPHGSDHLGRLFRQFVSVGKFQEYLRDYTRSTWPRLPWVEANYFAVIPSTHKPQRWVRERLKRELQNPVVELPLFTLACQRLSVWEPDDLRDILRATTPNFDHPAYRRVAAYSALHAGERRLTVRRWLDEFPANAVTLKILEERNFSPPRVTRDYSAGSSADDD